MSKIGNILESIREYILTCPFLRDGKVSINYMGVEAGYSIDILPCEPVLKQYVDGSQLRQFTFAFTTTEAFGGDVLAAIESSGFLQEFEEWIEINNENRVLPNLNSTALSAERIAITTSGYLIDVDKNNGRYQIQLKLEYFKEAK